MKREQNCPKRPLLGAYLLKGCPNMKISSYSRNIQEALPTTEHPLKVTNILDLTMYVLTRRRSNPVYNYQK